MIYLPHNVYAWDIHEGDKIKGSKVILVNARDECLMEVVLKNGKTLWFDKEEIVKVQRKTPSI